MSPAGVGEAITRAHHEEWARVVATLTRHFGDLDVAEEAAAEAFATAVERWPADGVPPSPGGWLTTTARRKALDRIRRENKRDDKQKQAQMMHDDDPLARLRPGDRLLEVGCATGKATIPLARRGFRITCVELGADLAAEARRNLTGFPRVNIVNRAFETWQPPQAGFDLVFAATAWHWIDPAVRYQRAWDLLRDGGHLAFWAAAHAFPAGGDRFFHEVQDVYDEINEGLPPGAQFPEPGELPDERAEIEASGLFTGVEVRRFGWEVSYTAEEYIRLLDTFSGHIAMAQWQRDRLYGEIRRRLAERPGGRLRRGWGAVLHVARRRGTGRGSG